MVRDKFSLLPFQISSRVYLYFNFKLSFSVSSNMSTRSILSLKLPVRQREPPRSPIQWSLSPEMTRPGSEAGRSAPCSAKFKVVWSCVSSSPYALLKRRLVQHRDNSILPCSRPWDCQLSSLSYLHTVCNVAWWTVGWRSRKVCYSGPCS